MIFYWKLDESLALQNPFWPAEPALHFLVTPACQSPPLARPLLHGRALPSLRSSPPLQSPPLHCRAPLPLQSPIPPLQGPTPLLQIPSLPLQGPFCIAESHPSIAGPLRHCRASPADLASFCHTLFLLHLMVREIHLQNKFGHFIFYVKTPQWLPTTFDPSGFLQHFDPILECYLHTNFIIDSYMYFYL